MHPRIREVLDYLVTAKVHLREAVEAVPPRAIDARPSPERWSVPEVLEHLALVNTGIVKLVATKVARAREAGLGPDRETSSVIWTLDVSRAIDRRERNTAPERTRPRQGLTAGAAWDAVDASHAALREAVLAGDGLAFGELSHPHPFLGTLNLYQWVAFAAAHEFRHAAQIREISSAAK
jgi:hypothetical protein